VAVPFARCKVQGAEVAVGAERFINKADALAKLAPVECRHRPHAGDHVADRRIHRGLALVFHSHQLVGRRPHRGELFVEPPQRGRRLRILLAQALDELHGEGDWQGGGLERLEGQGAGRSPAEPEPIVRQRVGVMAGRASLHDPLGQAPEVLHQAIDDVIMAPDTAVFYASRACLRPPRISQKNC
jgi:hypothetical protein